MFSFKFPVTWALTNYEKYYFLCSYPTAGEKGVLAPTNNAHTCREFFIQHWRKIISDYSTDDPRIKKAFALVTLGRPYEKISDAWQNKLDRYNEISLHVLNSFERKYKWALTRVYPVKSADSRKIPSAFFIGDRRWTMSPYLMSIWTLGIRMGRNTSLSKEILTLNNKQLAKQLSGKTNREGDIPQVRNTITHWGPIMSHYNELFGGRTRKDNWSQRHLHGGNDRPEGVLKLVTGTTAYKELKAKYLKLREAENHK